jgi:hypothetical protein
MAIVESNRHTKNCAQRGINIAVEVLLMINFLLKKFGKRIVKKITLALPV